MPGPLLTVSHVMRMTPAQLRRAVAAGPTVGPNVVRYLDVAAAWPLWEDACRQRPTWAMRMSAERCVIVDLRAGGVERVVVPSGPPGEAIRRAYLIAGLSSST